MNRVRAHRVVVLGASPKPTRYSNQAVRLLREHGYPVIPVNPAFDEIEGLPAVRRLAEVEPPVHTLTLYVSASRLPAMGDDILALRPGRVIFNPGTESPPLQARLDEAGIPWLEGCTLVMLRTGVFLDAA
jgi:predicted CoA-binding protein